MRLCASVGEYRGADAPLFRKRCGANHSRLGDDAVDAGVIAKEMRRDLKAAGIYEGETSHSWRRGAVQAGLAAAGFSHAKDRMLVGSDKVVWLYGDSDRPTRQVKRAWGGGPGGEGGRYVDYTIDGDLT